MKCFNYHQQIKKQCKKNSCRYWIEYKKNYNCCVISARDNKKLTLEDVGKIFNVTRMRICQIEKNALEKLKDVVGKIIN